VSFGEWNCRVQLIGATGAADGENRCQSRIARALQNGVAVLVELLKLKMGVRVDDIQAASLELLRLANFSRARRLPI
jgi:hypothetical protein